MKKQFLLSVFQLIITTLIFYIPLACSRVYYHPNMHNVPMLLKKGDIRANVALSQGNELTAVELQGAYAIKEHTGLMLNYIGAQASGGWENGHGGYLEGGGGYFSPIGGHGSFEAYGGGGFGSIANFKAYADKKPFYPIYFGKAFVQPSIGLHSKVVDVAVSLRMGGIYYFPYAAPDSAHLYSLESAFAIENHAYGYVEPAVTVRGGWKWIKLQAQLGLNYMDMPAARSQVNLNLGLYGDISGFAEAWRGRKK